MKRVEYFNSTYELNNYYPNGVSNDVLAIVGDEDATVLFTSSNNQPVSGSIPQGEGQGGYVPPEGYIFPQGYAYITANGDHDVSAYAYTNVDVPVPAGYIVPEGLKEVTANGDYDVTSYSNLTVLVEGQTEYEYTEITENGHVNVSTYGFAYVSVPVPAGYVLPEGTYNITANGSYSIAAYENVNVNVPGQNTIIPVNNYNMGNNGSYILTCYCLGADVEITYENTSYTCYAFGIGRGANYDENSYTFERYAYVIKDEGSTSFNNLFKVGYNYAINAKREFTYSSNPIIYAVSLFGPNNNILYGAKESQFGGNVDMTITDNGTFFAGHAKSVTVNIPKAADFYLYDTNSDARTALISNGDTTDEEIDGNQVTCYTFSATVSKSNLTSTDINYHRIIDANTGYVLHFTYSDIAPYALGESSDGVFEGNVIALNRGDSTYTYDQLNWQMSESSADLYDCTVEFSLKVPLNPFGAGYKYILNIKVTGSVA